MKTNENNIFLLTNHLFNFYLIFNRSNEPVITPEAYIEETSQIEGFHESLCELKNDLTELEKSTTKNSNFPRVIFLGTGSCIPNKTRNTSAILIQLRCA